MIELDLKMETLQKLKELTGKNQYEFLGFCLDLEKSALTDYLPQSMTLNEWANQVLTTLLCHYSLAVPILPTGKLIKFKDTPGGYAYEEAFVKRAIEPVAEVFGQNPKELIESSKLLSGTKLTLGDASVEIPALGIPLTYVLWGKEEFPASANILYDTTASCYLPTEDLAVLGELCTLRLIEARKHSFIS